MITFAPAKLAGRPYERLDQALACLQWGASAVCKGSRGCASTLGAWQAQAL